MKKSEINVLDREKPPRVPRRKTRGGGSFWELIEGLDWWLEGQGNMGITLRTKGYF